MAVTNIDNQDDALKIKLESFFKKSLAFRKEKGFCPVRDLLATFLDKWSLFIMYNLGYHEMLRFNQLKKYIPDISSRMLSVTLKRLEENEIISRRIYPEVPPRVEYRLTDFGKAMASKVLDMSDFVVDRYQ